MPCVHRQSLMRLRCSSSSWNAVDCICLLWHRRHSSRIGIAAINTTLLRAQLDPRRSPRAITAAIDLRAGLTPSPPPAAMGQQLRHESCGNGGGLRPRVWLCSGWLLGAIGPRWNLTIGREANFSLSWDISKRTQNYFAWGCFPKIPAAGKYIFRLLQEGRITDEARRRIERELDLEEASLAFKRKGEADPPL